jgi:hypothetical protein
MISKIDEENSNVEKKLPAAVITGSSVSLSTGAAISHSCTPSFTSESNFVGVPMDVSDDTPSLDYTMTSLADNEFFHTGMNSDNFTGRPPIQLYLTCDDDVMSQYQCLVRKQIKLFEPAWKISSPTHKVAINRLY